MKMPDRYAVQVLRPLVNQTVVCIFITVNDIGDQRPVKSWMSMPILNPPVVTLNIQNAALGPHGKCTVVKNEGLANLCHYAHIVPSRERYERMATGQKSNLVPQVAANRRPVVVDQSSSLVVSMNTP